MYIANQLYFHVGARILNLHSEIPLATIRIVAGKGREINNLRNAITIRKMNGDFCILHMICVYAS
jgi:hypothetical protein